MGICLILCMRNEQKFIGRPLKCRYVKQSPQTTYFKPRGIPLSNLDEICLTIDEFEAIRLADYHKMYHADAAKKMGISRQTFGRIIAIAHQKIGDVIVNGKAIKIEGGNYNIKE